MKENTRCILTEQQQEELNMNKTKRLVGLALFTAIVVVLQVLGSFIHFGSFSISLTLIPIVVGAALYGAGAGAFLGGVFGVVVLINCINGTDPGGYVLWTANPFLTAVLCLAKGVLAGYAAGLVYRLLEQKNKIVGTILAAVVCPVVNTGIFCLGLALCFYDTLIAWAGGASVVYYVLVVLAGVNFLAELVVNVVVSPIIVRIINVGKKM